MSTKLTMGHEKMLFSFVISSADMRHIERSEREIYLRYTRQNEPIVRGEMPDCGSGCYADLGQVLLEYVMSCEGCKDDIIEADMAQGFGERLGKVLAKKLAFDAPAIDQAGRIKEALTCVWRSLNVPFTFVESASELQYNLAHEPIEASARQAGISRGQPMARRVLIALCRTLIESVAPDWQMQNVPTAFDHPLGAITLVKAEQAQGS